MTRYAPAARAAATPSRMNLPAPHRCSATRASARKPPDTAAGPAWDARPRRPRQKPRSTHRDRRTPTLPPTTPVGCWSPPRSGHVHPVVPGFACPRQRRRGPAPLPPAAEAELCSCGPLPGRPKYAAMFSQAASSDRPIDTGPSRQARNRIRDRRRPTPRHATSSSRYRAAAHRNRTRWR